MTQLGTRMNLKPHMGGVSNEKVLIHGPTDIGEWYFFVCMHLTSDLTHAQRAIWALTGAFMYASEDLSHLASSRLFKVSSPGD